MSDWKNPISATPSIVQTDFGGWGQLIAGDGEAYCGPTALVMGLYWLYNNGFTQVAPAAFVTQDSSETVNLERVIAGLMETSSDTGTNGTVCSGITTYLSACGIPPSQYSYTSNGNPDLQWLATQLAPNVTPGSDTIVLADFSVGWYVSQQGDPTSLVNGGGHVLCPLTVDLDKGTLTLNNPWPPSFEDVSQSASNNPQTVQIVPVPAKYTLGPPLDTGESYSWVISGNKGNGSFAVLWGADIFAISNAALPGAPYVPATWELPSGMQTINTNGGVLTVQAPLDGAGGIAKTGEGTLLLTGGSTLTGGLTVNGGIVASTVTTGTPLGLGSISLSNNGVLSLSYWASTVSVQIASAANATLTALAGGGCLQLVSTGSALVTIGGNTDGITRNLGRDRAGTLVLQPNCGLTGLGIGQQVQVAGTTGNLPPVTNGMVAPWLLGRDNDPAGSGAFLTYGANGFSPATTTSSADTAINDAPADAIYQVVAGADQTVSAGSTASVAALELDGGSIDATNATLQVGGQTAGELAGLILNGGTISGGTLAFGAAEAILYASMAPSSSTIGSTVSGSGGLTLCGPGGVLLDADNSASLSGSVVLNSGTLVAASPNGATGSGEVFVNSMATLAVIGTVGSSVWVGQSATLLLDGGTVTGTVTIGAVGTSTSLPGGNLQGNGTLSGAVVAAGNLLSGDEPGLMVFADTVILPGTGAFYLRPQGLVDDKTSTFGQGWNALQIDQQEITIGEDGSPWSIYIDFSMMQGDPDSGNVFWSVPHTWSLITFAGKNWGGHWDVVNGYYASGQFGTAWPDPNILTLTWTPANIKRSPAELLALRAQARARRTLAARKRP